MPRRMPPWYTVRPAPPLPPPVGPFCVCGHQPWRHVRVGGGQPGTVCLGSMWAPCETHCKAYSEAPEAPPPHVSNPGDCCPCPDCEPCVPNPTKRSPLGYSEEHPGVCPVCSQQVWTWGTPHGLLQGSCGHYFEEKHCVCGEPWPCSTARRTDIKGLERAKHYVRNNPRRAGKPSKAARAFIAAEIAHLIRDKGYDQQRAIAAAYAIARRKGYRSVPPPPASNPAGYPLSGGEVYRPALREYDRYGRVIAIHRSTVPLEDLPEAHEGVYPEHDESRSAVRSRLRRQMLAARKARKGVRRASNPKVLTGRATLEDARSVPGFEAAASEFKRWTGAEPSQATVFRVGTGKKEGSKVVVNLGYVPEVHYILPDHVDSPEKSSYHFVHKTDKKRMPCLLWSPDDNMFFIAGGVMRIGKRAGDKVSWLLEGSKPHRG